METTLVSVVVSLVIMVSATVVAKASFTSFDRLHQTAKVMDKVSEERARTALTVQSTIVSGDGSTLYVTLRNTGQSRLADFSRMDVILNYTADLSGPTLVWLPNTTAAPAANQWAATAIVPDVIDPRVLNPGEELTVTAVVSPVIATGSTNAFSIATPNGVVAEGFFTR